MPDLYYQNLGIERPDETKIMVETRLGEFWKYLDNYKNRLAQKEYKFRYFDYEVIGTVKYFIDAVIQNPFDADKYFFDKELVNEISEDWIDRHRQQFKFYSVPQDSKIFGKFGNQIHALKFFPEFYALIGVEPIDIEEDEENEAMELLSFSHFIVWYDRDRENFIEKIEFQEKDGRLIIRDLPSGEGKFFWIKNFTYIVDRQRDALKMLIERPQKHHIPLLNLLQKNTYFQWEQFDLIPDPEQYYILTDDTRDGIKEQREFVKKAISTPDFAILEGPPGSGKTTVLVEIVAQMLSHGKRILMVGSTHIAVDNILERLQSVEIQIGSSQKNLIDACGIFPLRIGDEGNVSEDIRKFCLKQRAQTEKERIRQNLEKLEGKLSKSQLRLLRCVSRNDKGGERIIQNFLYDAANLVCGTTIGVLQAEIIKEKRAHSSSPLFDLVIIDEASKTTFQEFLVPAIYGRRWIISGDVRQLSPYVDPTEILANLSALPGFDNKYRDMEKYICLSAFFAADTRKLGKNRGTIIPGVLTIVKNIDEIDSVVKTYQDQITKLAKIKYLYRNAEDFDFNLTITGIKIIPLSAREKLEIQGSDIIVTTRDLMSDIEPYLPPTIVFSEYVFSEVFKSRRKSFFNLIDRTLLQRILPDDDKTWENEVQWRICRLHELRDNERKAENFEKQIRFLVPFFNTISSTSNSDNNQNEDRGTWIFNQIGSIRRIALPSIIEILQKGFEPNFNVPDMHKIALYSGLGYSNTRPDIFQPRHTLLSYQHRMHPDISRFPRESIYEGQALKDSRDVLKGREWNYSRYKNSHSVWIDIKPNKDQIRVGRIGYNLAEIDAMVKEFKFFLDWSRINKNHGDNEGCWSVAFLSFYKGQFKRIMKDLQPFSKKTGYYTQFTNAEYNIKGIISTVDRFQGKEADLVFLSFVRSKGGTIGFLDNTNRLNVAITRARYQLVIFGDKLFFKLKTRDDPILKKLAEESKPGPIYLEVTS